MNEIYRSFDGKLGVSCQSGYILYSLNNGDLIEYEGLSVWGDAKTERARIPARYLAPSEYSDFDKIAELVAECYYGTLPDGQIYISGKWWTYDAICKIQRQHHTNNWHCYI